MTTNFPILARATNLPIEHLESLKQFYKVLAALEGKKVRIRYRGPRRKYPSGRISYEGKNDCLKKDAKAFAVYFV
jgi:hypothetical protein